MIFTDASQPTFPDPWDFPTLTDISGTADMSIEEKLDPHEPSIAAIPYQTKPHSGWRDMLADIQHGLQWGLNH